MKTITQRLMKVLMVALMLLIPLGINNSVVYAEDTGNTYELKEGVVYQIGDTIKLSGDDYICFDDDDTAAALASVGEYQIPDATFENPYNVLGFEYFINMVEVDYPYGLYFYNNLGGGLYTPTGIRCISGDGSKEKPFRFEPTFSKELAKDVEYKIGDTIQLSANAYIITDDEYSNDKEEILAGNYPLEEPFYNDYEDDGQFLFENIFIRTNLLYEDMYLGFNTGLTGKETVTGIRCIGGNGKDDNPFVFVLMFDNTPSTDPTVIDTIDLTITPPVPGTSTKLAIPYDFESQTNPPIVSIPNGVDYYLNTGEDNEYLGAYWVDEMDLEEPFEDTFKVNNYYLANIYLKSNTGHVFSEDVTINITNGSLYDNFFMDTKKDYISITAYVKCVEQHKVTFDANGGTIDGASKKEIPVVDGKVFKYDELPEPTKEGQYWFDFWYTDQACKNEFEYWKTPIKAPITLYAKWEKYYIAAVDFKDGIFWGESKIEKQFNKEYEEIIPTEKYLLDRSFEAPEGMRYVGVNIEGKQYKPGDVYLVKEKNVEASVVYVPVGKDVLTFDLDGGKLGDQVGVAFLPYDNGKEIKLPAPTKDGATFDYWEGSKYYAGDPYTVNGDKVFKAVWKANPTPKPNYSIPKTGVE